MVVHAVLSWGLNLNPSRCSVVAQDVQQVVRLQRCRVHESRVAFHEQLVEQRHCTCVLPETPPPLAYC